MTWLAIKALKDEEIARIIGWSPKNVATIRERDIDETRTVTSLIGRLNARSV